MLTIRSDIEEFPPGSSDKIISRFKWIIDTVESVYLSTLTTGSYSGNRIIIGKIDEKSKTIIGYKRRKLFKKWLPLIIFKLQLQETASSTRIHIRYFPGLATLLFTLALYLGATSFILTSFETPDLDTIFGSILWILTFPVIWTIVLILQVNNVENLIIEILEQGQNEA